MLKNADNPEGTEQSTFDEMTNGMKEDRAKFFAGLFQDFYGISMMSPPTSDEHAHASWTVAMQASLKATLARATAFSSSDFRPDLCAFRCPTLIIHGTADKTVPIGAAGRAAAKGIANSKLLEYGEPHGLFATAKERLPRDLLAFLLH